MQGYTQLYRDIHSYTELYTAIEGYTQLYRAIHSYTGLLTALKGVSLERTCGAASGGVTSFNKLVLYGAIHNYAGLRTAIQSRAVLVQTQT